MENYENYKLFSIKEFLACCKKTLSDHEMMRSSSSSMTAANPKIQNLLEYSRKNQGHVRTRLKRVRGIFLQHLERKETRRRRNRQIYRRKKQQWRNNKGFYMEKEERKGNWDWYAAMEPQALRRWAMDRITPKEESPSFFLQRRRRRRRRKRRRQMCN